jgi:hypothetical protein
VIFEFFGELKFTFFIKKQSFKKRYDSEMLPSSALQKLGYLS